jgi:DNA modification methylase
MRGVFANLPMTDAGQVLVNLGLIHREGEWVPYWDEWIDWMREHGWRRFGWYVWDKKAALPGDWSGRLAPRHEWVFHFNRQSVDAMKVEECATAGQVISGPAPRGKDGKRKPMHGDGNLRNDMRIRDSVCVVSKTAGGDHPAVMPVGLPEFYIESWPGVNVYDPFLGSGTTMVAAQNLGRKCYGIEIAPAYCAVILERMATAFPGIEIKREE